MDEQKTKTNEHKTKTNGHKTKTNEHKHSPSRATTKQKENVYLVEPKEEGKEKEIRLASF